MKCDLLFGSCDRPATIIFRHPYAVSEQYSCVHCADGMSREWGLMWKEIKLFEKDSCHKRYRTKRAWLSTVIK